MTRIIIYKVVACPELKTDVEVENCEGCKWNWNVGQTEVDCAYPSDKE